MGYLRKIEAIAKDAKAFSVYIMDEKHRDEAGKTVPTQYALNRSKDTGKKINLSIWGQNISDDICKELKKVGLLSNSAKANEVEYDGDSDELGVWYKDVYIFTLIADKKDYK